MPWFVGFLRASALAAAILVSTHTVAFGGATHPATVDDLFKFENIDSPSISLAPNGRLVAFSRARSVASSLRAPHLFFAYTASAYAGAGIDASDIWLSRLDGTPPVNLTNGELEGASYWRPTWSPDGANLAMLSTKGGDARLWIWEQRTNRLRLVSERGISLSGPSYVWMDNRHLAAIYRPRHGDELGLRGMQGAQAARDWQKSWAGKEATASVLDSESGRDTSPCQLVLIDVIGATTRPVAEAPAFLDLNPSPDGRFLAFSQRLPARSAAFEAAHIERRSANWHYRLQLGLVDSNGADTLAVYRTSVFSSLSRGSFTWAPDSQAFSFVGTASEEADALLLFRGSVRGPVQIVSLPADVTVSANLPVQWTETNQLLLPVPSSRQSSAAAQNTAHNAWWIVSNDGKPHQIGAQQQAVPSRLLPVGDRRTFVGVAAGDLWRLDLDRELWTNLTAAFAPIIETVSGSHASDPTRTACRSVLVSASDGPSAHYYLVDTASGDVKAVIRPSDHAMPVAYRGDTGDVVFFAEESNGTFITVARDKSIHTVLATNGFMSEVAKGQFRLLTYRGMDGQELKGWLLLPPDYESGKPRPLITWVYGGRMYSDTPPSALTCQFCDPIFALLHVLAGHGYVILLPSMPLAPDGIGSQPFLELTKGVLPAVDQAIIQGFADPMRLGVMGHSYGGYSTYGLVTQTARFRAAVAMAGPSDLISMYGQLIPSQRYETHYDYDVRELQSLTEAGPLKMGSPPWADFGRYLQNSPLFYVSRVITPLMIVQGDMDFVPMTQGEEFFTALCRQGKRAKFVRYWGEAHIPKSPANIRDLYDRVLTWFDELLVAPSVSSTTTTHY